jgi:HEAT repeat protein
MTSRGYLGLLLVTGLLVVPASYRQELFSQEPTAATSPLDSSAWDVLRKGMDDGDAQRRKTVIAAIGTIGPEPEAVKLVVRGLQDKDTLVRQTAAATLGEMGAHDAVQHLKAALDDSPEVSFTAAKSLWQLGDTSSREIIQAVMAGERSDKPSMLHSAMKDAKHRLRPSQLALMGFKEASGTFLGPGSMGIDAIQEAMKEAKKDSAAPGRAAAAAILAKDPDPYTLVLLEWGLGDNNWAVRVAVTKALVERGNKQTIVKLSPLRSDDHHAVRYMLPRR